MVIGISDHHSLLRWWISPCMLGSSLTFIVNQRSVLMVSSRESASSSSSSLTLVGGQSTRLVDHCVVLAHAISRHFRTTIIACGSKRLLINTVILVGIGLLHVTVIRLSCTWLCLWVLFSFFACLIVVFLSQNPLLIKCFVKSIALVGALGKHWLVRVGIDCRIFREIQTTWCGWWFLEEARSRIGLQRSSLVFKKSCSLWGRLYFKHKWRCFIACISILILSTQLCIGHTIWILIPLSLGFWDFISNLLQ